MKTIKVKVKAVKANAVQLEGDEAFVWHGKYGNRLIVDFFVVYDLSSCMIYVVCCVDI